MTQALIGYQSSFIDWLFSTHGHAPAADCSTHAVTKAGDIMSAASESVVCARLLKTRRGEVAEWLKAAVC